jgi:hypothetical protein
MRNRSYSELRRFETLEERYAYLKLNGAVGYATFGLDRYVNQAFYMSRQWRQLRSEIILRDNGCDLGIEGFKIHKGLYIHHMNPMTVAEITAGDPDILNPDFLITVSHRTHNAIHYGDETQLPRGPVERKPGDTRLW